MYNAILLLLLVFVLCKSFDVLVLLLVSLAIVPVFGLVLTEPIALPTQLYEYQPTETSTTYCRVVGSGVAPCGSIT